MPIGFKNEGNTCWMNAMLQCMLHVPQLVNFVRDDMFESCLLQKRKNACEFAIEFSKLAKTYWSLIESTATPDAITEAFMRVHRSFKGKRHKHDAGEALLLSIDTLHTALGNVGHLIDDDDDQHPMPFEGNEDEWAKHVAHTGNSPILDIFTGQQLVGTVYEHFTSVMLDPMASVDKAFESLTFTYLPLILIATIKKSEDKQFVGYSDTLSLRDAAYHVDYALFAVLMHHGTSADGHWTALVHHLGKWTHVDDERQTVLTDLNDIIQKDAVMLLYKRLLPTT